MKQIPIAFKNYILEFTSSTFEKLVRIKKLISKILKDRDKSLIKVIFEYLTVLITVTIAWFMGEKDFYCFQKLCSWIDVICFWVTCKRNKKLIAKMLKLIYIYILRRPQILRNLHCRFDWPYIGQIYSWDFAKTFGLLWIYEL